MKCQGYSRWSWSWICSVLFTLNSFSPAWLSRVASPTLTPWRTPFCLSLELGLNTSEKICVTSPKKWCGYIIKRNHNLFLAFLLFSLLVHFPILRLKRYLHGPRTGEALGKDPGRATLAQISCTEVVQLGKSSWHPGCRKFSAQPNVPSWWWTYLGEGLFRPVIYHDLSKDLRHAN